MCHSTPAVVRRQAPPFGLASALDSRRLHHFCECFLEFTPMLGVGLVDVDYRLVLFALAA